MACEGPNAPGGAAIVVEAGVGGEGRDPDGFLAEVDGITIVSVGANEPAVVAPVEEGDHVVRLLGLSENCMVQGDEEQQLAVRAADTARAHFTILCSVAAGAVHVIVRTTGMDRDPSGYEVSREGSAVGHVGANDDLTVAFPAGHHDLGLERVASNCEVQGQNPLGVDVTPEGLSRANFEVACTEALPAGPGHELVFVTSRDLDSVEQHGIYVMNDDGAGLRPLPVPGLFLDGVDWSPTGDSVVFTREVDPSGDLAILDLESGVTTPIPNTESSLGPAWSPDGTWIAYELVPDDSQGFFSHIVLTAPDGTRSRVVAAHSTGLSQRPAWSPDGTRLAYVYTAHDGSIVEIRVLNPADSSERVIRSFPDVAGIESLDWSPDGSQMVISMPEAAERLQLYILDVAGLEAPTQLTFGARGSFAPAWSPDGSRVAFTRVLDEEDAELFTIDPATALMERLTDSPGWDDAAAWRPLGPP